jgi:hypothetical protein
VAGREEAAADRVVERDWPEDLPAALWQAELTALLPVVTPDGEAPCPTRGGAISSRCSAARRPLRRSRRARSRRYVLTHPMMADIEKELGVSP